MIITITSGRQAEITDISIARQQVDFRWIDGDYSGDCSAPCEIEAWPVTEEQVIAALDGVVEV